MSKQEIMKKLLDLYEQRKFVQYAYIVDEYISKLEKELKEML